MTDELIYLAEITVYDPNIAGTRVLRYSNAAFTTKPSETPANAYYAERIIQPATMKRFLFDEGTTQGSSQFGYGDLILKNDDGELDALIGYGFDGQPIVIRSGLPGAAYPSGFPEFLVATARGMTADMQTVTVKLRDRQIELNSPLQPTKYAGDNVLPAGVEGVATDLKGKPKPDAYGFATNCPCPCVNTTKLIFQARDGEIAGITVYDEGIELSTSANAWASRTSGAGATAIRGLAYGASIYVWVADSGKLFSSPDGTTWTSRTSTFGAGNILGVCFGTIFVAVGAAGALATSADGITWTSQTSGFSATNINGVCYGTVAGVGLYVAVGDSGKLFTSPDGVTWTSRTSSFGAANIFSVTYGNGLFVAVGVGRIATSPDGITWTLQAFIAAFDYHAVAYGNGVYVVAATSGVIGSSPDGVSWTQRTSGFGITSGLTLAGLTFGNGNFVVVGPSGSIGTSVNGVTWTLRTSALATDINAVAFGSNLFVAAGASGGLETSAVASSYATLADLMDDSLQPAAGTFKYYLAGGYFRLGSKPIGLPTADITQGATAADRTAGQIFKQILERAGYTSADYSASDITALDSANSAVIGFWTAEETTLMETLDKVAQSVGAAWYVDRSGTFRIKRFVKPSYVTDTPVASFTANDTLVPFEHIESQDPDAGMPVYRVIVRYAKSYAVQDTDLADGVTQARREIVNKEWREATYTDDSVQDAYPLARQIIVETLLTTAADALAEATRLQQLKSTLHDPIKILVPLSAANAAIELSDSLEFTHDRYGLSREGDDTGKLFVVTGVEPDARAKTVALSCWGPSKGGDNLVTDDGVFLVTSDGDYLVLNFE